MYPSNSKIFICAARLLNFSILNLGHIEKRSFNSHNHFTQCKLLLLCDATHLEEAGRCSRLLKVEQSRILHKWLKNHDSLIDRVTIYEGHAKLIVV